MPDGRKKDTYASADIDRGLKFEVTGLQDRRGSQIRE
jgi:hypothetical protein